MLNLFCLLNPYVWLVLCFATANTSWSLQNITNKLQRLMSGSIRACHKLTDLIYNVANDDIHLDICITCMSALAFCTSVIFKLIDDNADQARCSSYLSFSFTLSIRTTCDV